MKVYISSELARALIWLIAMVICGFLEYAGSNAFLLFSKLLALGIASYYILTMRGDRVCLCEIEGDKK